MRESVDCSVPLAEFASQLRTFLSLRGAGGLHKPLPLGDAGGCQAIFGAF